MRASDIINYIAKLNMNVTVSLLVLLKREALER